MATTTLAPGGKTYERSWVLDWLTTVDHKKIGVLYIVNSFVFFFFAGLLALVIRSELAVPGLQFVDESTFNQAFTMHGTLMIFLFIVPIFSGFGNYVVPLMIGAPDMAFPRINALSFWMLPLGGGLIVAGYLVGGAAAGGWTGYNPLTQERFSPGDGTDLWIMGLAVVGTASILGSVNFLTTIFKMRAPGMTLFRMPIFVWTVLVTQALILLATPVITAALIALFIDRNYGGSFFDPSVGGDPILWQHLFWFFGHPEVYVVLLPTLGIVADIIAVFSRKKLFGYRTIIYTAVATGVISFFVWAHHQFVAGIDPRMASLFSVTTLIISVPIAELIFVYIATLYGGSITLSTPMLWALSFLATFLIGGVT
ncbi:MAG TPA: cbb3-type cytochrome c oxidase subunit I, partial [Candidatus Limnocylindria bacterium]